MGYTDPWRDDPEASSDDDVPVPVEEAESDEDNDDENWEDESDNVQQPGDECGMIIFKRY